MNLFAACKAELRDNSMTELKAPFTNPLTRGQGASLWRQIANILEAEIAAGDYAGDDGRIPTEKVLSARFDVNRHTVRRALAALAEQGVVKTEQGRGVFVNRDLIAYPLGQRVRFTETLSASDRAPEGLITEISREKAPTEVARDLELKSGALVWRVQRLGRADDLPISLAHHYVSAARFPEFGDAFAGQTSITTALSANGVKDYARRETRVSARPATADEIRLLDLTKGRPVLVTEGVNVTPDGAPVEVSHAAFAADRVRLIAHGAGD